MTTDDAADALAAVPRRVKRAVKALDDDLPSDCLAELARVRQLLDAVEAALGQTRIETYDGGRAPRPRRRAPADEGAEVA